MYWHNSVFRLRVCGIFTLSMEIRKVSPRGLLIKQRGVGVGVNLFPKEDRGGYRSELNMVLYTDGDEGRKENGFSGLKVVGPGEYESRGVEVQGWHVNSKNSEGRKSNVYVVKMDGLTLCVVGKIKEGLTDSLIEKIGAVDILFLDLGSEIKITELWEQVKKLGPNMVIPVNFLTDKDKEVKEFLDVADRESVESVEKIKVDSSTLPEDRVVVILNGSR